MFVVSNDANGNLRNKLKSHLFLRPLFCQKVIICHTLLLLHKCLEQMINLTTNRTKIKTKKG